MGKSEIFGYILVGLGVLTIIAAVINIFLVFTNEVDPIQFYKPGDIEIDLNAFIPQYQTPDIPGLNQVIPQPQAPTLSSDVLTESLNLLIHLFVVGFIMNAAFKIASIGTQMTRPIIVKINKTEQVVSPSRPTQKSPSSKLA